MYITATATTTIRCISWDLERNICRYEQDGVFYVVKNGKTIYSGDCQTSIYYFNEMGGDYIQGQLNKKKPIETRLTF